MREVIIIEKDEVMELSILIAESIIEYAQKFYGFSMISRKTNTEMDPDMMLGVLAVPIRKALKEGKI
jgi:competence transcription factor ComK